MFRHESLERQAVKVTLKLDAFLRVFIVPLKFTIMMGRLTLDTEFQRVELASFKVYFS